MNDKLLFRLERKNIYLKRRNQVLINKMRLMLSIISGLIVFIICFIISSNHKNALYIEEIEKLKNSNKFLESEIVKDFGTYSSIKNDNDSYQNQITNLESKNADLQNQITNLESKNADLQNQIYAIQNDLATMTQISKELDDQNKELVDLYNQNNQDIKILLARKELYDKYSYAIINSENGERTDITYNDIATLESLAQQKGMGKDAVDFILAVCMTESRGNANAKNLSSTASGLGQLLYTTAKFVYEDLMGNGKNTYKSSYAFDHSINIKMSLYYIDYLAKQNNRDTTKICVGYAGGYDKTWIDKVDSYLQNVGKSIYTIKI